MLAFAGNSLLGRLALDSGSIDPVSFTSIRSLAGAITLAALVCIQQKQFKLSGSWASAFALFAYAATFSFAYSQLGAATGALVLFGAVQISMIGFGLLKGEQINRAQYAGLGCAIAGLVVLLLPGLSAPPLFAALLMATSGIAWAVYSVLGKSVSNPTFETAGNFIRSLPMALGLVLLFIPSTSPTADGVFYAIASGAITSGIGYALWYAALPHLQSVTAATIQLSVPVITAVGGLLLLNENISLRLAIASVAVLGGVWIFLHNGNQSRH